MTLMLPIEFYWAETELYLLTEDEAYKQSAMQHRPSEFTPAVWGNVAELASLEWIMHREKQIDFALECQDALLSHLLPYVEEAETVSVLKHRTAIEKKNTSGDVTRRGVVGKVLSSSTHIA